MAKHQFIDRTPAAQDESREAQLARVDRLIERNEQNLRAARLAGDPVEKGHCERRLEQLVDRKMELNGHTLDITAEHRIQFDAFFKLEDAADSARMSLEFRRNGISDWRMGQMLKARETSKARLLAALDAMSLEDMKEFDKYRKWLEIRREI